MRWMADSFPGSITERIPDAKAGHAPALIRISAATGRLDLR